MDGQAVFFTKLQGLCDERKRSMTDVVTSSGLSSCLVTAWKRGASPTLATVLKLAQELQVPPTDLLPQDNQ
ncbi:helix-turn-helix domain-containing protein [Flavonifractor plautii]|uniref:helix-turn-helix domain-containing protein n=1 Tax=Flavonifractor plautii TaxID=292800 RepID=UPI003A382B45